MPHTYGPRRARQWAAIALTLIAAVTLATPTAVNADVRVRIEGLESQDDELRGNVRALLSIITLEKQKQPTSERQVQRFHRRAPDEIREALQPYGYYEPTIEGELEQPKETRWEATYRIAVGDVTRIRDVSVSVAGEGSEDRELLGVINDLPAQKGQPLRHSDYSKAKSMLLQRALSLGYLDARLTTNELRVFPVRRSAEIRLALETGQRFLFGEVSFDQRVLRREVLIRYVPFEPGDVLDIDKLLRLQFVMNDLDYYSEVDVELDRENTVDRRIPVNVRAVGRKYRRWTLGVGYGTDTGPRLSAGVEFRRLNSRGHRWRNDLRLSETKSSFTSQYSIPIGTRPGDTLTLAGSRNSEDLGDGRSNQSTLGLSRNAPRDGWQERLYLQFEREDFIVGTNLTRTDVLMPGISFSRTRTEDPLFTRSGWNFFVDIHGAEKNILSDTSFLQTRMRLKTILPLGRRGRLLNRVEFGASLVEAFSKLPGSQRFFSGGDQTVRGYSYQSIGPTDANGAVIGGEYLQNASVEVDYRIGRSWGLAAFYDVGSASDEPFEDIKAGAGIGYRYQSPVGMIRIDLARPLDLDNPGIRLHLGIGAEL